jgi:hypothetical protein
LKIRHSSLETNFFKFTASLIQIQEVGNGIIRDKQVHQAIVVDVRRDTAKGEFRHFRNHPILFERSWPSFPVGCAALRTFGILESIGVS